MSIPNRLPDRRLQGRRDPRRVLRRPRRPTSARSTATVSRLGALATITFPKGGGNAGPAQIDVGFKPPNGVGLSIDAGVVKGGGYLFIDSDAGEYAGALELTFAGFLSLKADRHHHHPDARRQPAASRC